ncbi:hypothetical protein NL676_019114 [Syzygium grande]|nr:hypothetical protein NL676_019114 [Syzygium grande]
MLESLFGAPPVTSGGAKESELGREVPSAGSAVPPSTSVAAREPQSRSALKKKNEKSQQKLEIRGSLSKQRKRA